MLLDRISLKREAKDIVKCARVSAYGFTLLFLAISWLLNGLSDFVSLNEELVYNIYYTTGVDLSFLILHRAFPPLLVTFVTVIVALLGVLLGAGYCLYQLGIRRGEEMPYLTLFDGFSFTGKLILLALVRYIFVFLWSMLFIIPGIIAAYRYSMATYIMAENPNMQATDAIERSKALMDGHKGDLFCLDLSFIGWALLASLTLQSPFMVLVVKLTADPNCFTSNLVNIGSRTALFILAAMATFMGTLNSYREICKEREIILREASVGVSLPAVVLSKAVVLFLIEILQSVILAMGFVAIVHVPQNHLLLETDIEIFVTLLLTMFSSSCVGLLISALFSNGESAILAVLVLMIGQVVFSNVMFTLTGAAATISTVIVCRWGMGALGASTDLNSRMAWLQAGLDGPMYDATVENLTHSWQMLGLISLVSLVAAWLVLQIAFDKKKA